jgi:ABC-type transport system involved in multi-copper enzyme maturation permease subunit
VKLLVLAGPLFCTPLFFGGVSFTEIATALLFPLSAAVWVAAVGLVCSALHRRAAPAVLWTYLAAVAWHVLGWGLLAFLELDGDPAVGAHLLPLWSYLLLPVLQNLNLHQPELLWMLPLETAAFAAVCVVLAGWLMGREEREGSGRETSVQVRRTVWNNPVAWKEVRATHTLAVRRLMSAVLALAGFSFFWALSKRWPLSVYGDAADIVYVVISIVVGAAGMIGAAWVRRRRFYWTAALIAAGAGLGLWGLAVISTPTPSQQGAGMMTSKMVLQPLLFFLLFFMILGGAVAGATAVIHERVRKTYEALRMTPLPARAFIQGKAWGCWWTLMPSGIVVLVTSIMSLLMGEMEALGLVLMLLVVFATLFAVVRLGLFVSARARRPARAVLLALGVLIGYLAVLPVVGALILWRDAEIVLYINPFYWIGSSMERSVGEHVAGCLCFCVGAVGVGLWLHAMAASAFKSERWIERR